MQRPLLILISEARDERLWVALSLALAQRRNGRQVSLFLAGNAAMMGLKAWHPPGDGKRAAYCTETVRSLFETAADEGVRLHACTTGLHWLEEPEDGLHIAVLPATLWSLVAHLPQAELLAF